MSIISVAIPTLDIGHDLQHAHAQAVSDAVPPGADDPAEADGPRPRRGRLCRACEVARQSGNPVIRPGSWVLTGSLSGVSGKTRRGGGQAAVGVAAARKPEGGRPFPLAGLHSADILLLWFSCACVEPEPLSRAGTGMQRCGFLRAEEVRLPKDKDTSTRGILYLR